MKSEIKVSFLKIILPGLRVAFYSAVIVVLKSSEKAEEVIAFNSKGSLALLNLGKYEYARVM